jgi:hypothetical protein
MTRVSGQRPLPHLPPRAGSKIPVMRAVAPSSHVGPAARAGGVPVASRSPPQRRQRHSASNWSYLRAVSLATPCRRGPRRRRLLWAPSRAQSRQGRSPRELMMRLSPASGWPRRHFSFGGVAGGRIDPASRIPGPTNAPLHRTRGRTGLAGTARLLCRPRSPAAGGVAANRRQELLVGPRSLRRLSTNRRRGSGGGHPG